MSSIQDMSELMRALSQISADQRSLVKFLMEFDTLSDREKRKGKSMIYSNQQRTADNVRKAFEENEDLLYVLVAAFTQSGKTGAMIALIKYYVVNGLVSPENVIIITGLSDVLWKEQTKDRCPEIIHSNVFHLNNLNGTFKNVVRGKKDVLILIDELHIACEAGDRPQTLAKVFDDIGLSNPDYCYENNIKFVEFSATPGKVLRDRKTTKERFYIIKDTPPTNYVGPRQLLTNGQLRPITDLTDHMNVTRLMKFIKDIYGHDYKYHFIRLPTKTVKQEKVMEYVRRISTNFGNMFDNTVMEFHGNGNIDTLDVLLGNKPTKHTFIFLKNMIGCAKTIEDKQHIGVWFSRYVKKSNGSTVIQDLRLTGYDVPSDVYIFCDVDIVRNYLEWWDSNFEIPFNETGGASRGLDQWAIDLINRETDPLRTTNLKWFIFDTRENAAHFVESNFKHINYKMGSARYKANDENYRDKTAKQLAVSQYQLSKSKNRFKRIVCGSDDKYAVYWDGDNSDAPTEIVATQLASESSE
tara:strand:+ start:100 stop:1674 length:1575 start_codon:yes stop_codon:yes gene_type:complete